MGCNCKKKARLREQQLKKQSNMQKSKRIERTHKGVTYVKES